MFSQLSNILNTLVEKVLLLLGITICLILFAQVLFRYAGASLGWSEEISRHLLVAITFLGATAAYKRSGLIGLQGVGKWFGHVIERIISLLLQLLTLGCFILLCWFGIAYTLKAWHHTTAALQIPMGIPFAVIPMSALIMSVHVVATMAATLRSGHRP